MRGGESSWTASVPCLGFLWAASMPRSTRIRSVPGLSLGGVDAAFYAFVNISATGMDSQTFAYELLKAQRVAVVPGLAYGDDFDDFIRIAFTVSGERLREAIGRLGAFVRRAT